MIVKKTQQYCECCDSPLITDVNRSWEDLCPKCNQEDLESNPWFRQEVEFEEEEEEFILEEEY